jgi:hypothetical protein
VRVHGVSDGDGRRRHKHGSSQRLGSAQESEGGEKGRPPRPAVRWEADAGTHASRRLAGLVAAQPRAESRGRGDGPRAGEGRRGTLLGSAELGQKAK